MIQLVVPPVRNYNTPLAVFCLVTDTTPKSHSHADLCSSMLLGVGDAGRRE